MIKCPEGVKTYANRKGHPVQKNRPREECAFPDGGIWVQDLTWSMKNGQILQIKLCCQEATEVLHTSAKIQQQHNSSLD
jgi:hypothetical protein